MAKLISRRKILAGSALSLGVTACSSEPPSGQNSKTGQPLATIYNTDEFLIPGPADRVLRIQVSHPLPDSTWSGFPEAMKNLKPVPVYVIDGGWVFGMLSGITRYLQWGGEQLPCMVVGIAYEDMVEADEDDFRRYDLTPPDPNWGEYSGEASSPNTVGGDADFRRFLIETLVPLIEEKYEVDSSQSTLFGHSFGGLFAMNTMLETPRAFSNILALSPSLWFADHHFLAELEHRLSDGSFVYPGKLAVYAGEREEQIAGETYRMTSNVVALADIIGGYTSSFGGAEIKVLPNRTHHNILGQATTLGLEFILSGKGVKR